MNLRSFSILARLELFQLRAFWRIAGRDPIFVLAILSFAAVAFAVVRKGTSLLDQEPAIGLFAALALGAFTARLVYPRGGGWVRETQVSGPLHLLICAPRDMAAWLLVRSLVLLGVIDVFATVAVASVSWRAALVWLVAFAIGGGLWSGLETRQVARTAPGAPIVRDDPRSLNGRSNLASAPLVLFRLALSSRVRGAPAWAAALATLVLGAVCAGLATHNNDSLGLGLGLTVAAASLASSLLAPNSALVPVLRREPVGLPRLYMWLYGPVLALGVVGGALAALAAGLGRAGAFEAAVTTLTLGLAASIMLFLHQLIRSPRLAPMGLGSDLLGAAMLGGIEISLSFLWLAARAGWLIHRARRVRWLDS